MICLNLINLRYIVHGAHGVSQDSSLSRLYMGLRTLRVADGPDIVHLNTIAKIEVNRKSSFLGKAISGVNQNIEKYGKFEHVRDIAFPAGKL